MVYSNCHSSSAFCLSLTFSLLCLPSAAKELFSWLFACAILKISDLSNISLKSQLSMNCTENTIEELNGMLEDK